MTVSIADQTVKVSIKGSVKNNLAFLYPNFTISLTDLHSQVSKLAGFRNQPKSERQKCELIVERTLIFP